MRLRRLILQILLLFSPFYLIKRRLSNVKKTALDHLLEMPVKERQQQRRMCAPSTSASVMMIILVTKSININSGPIEQPRAVTKVPTSWELNSLSNRAFSTFKFYLLEEGLLVHVRPCFAEPPAESPSTRNSSESAGSFSWQSANFMAVRRCPAPLFVASALEPFSRPRALGINHFRDYLFSL